MSKASEWVKSSPRPAFRRFSTGPAGLGSSEEPTEASAIVTDRGNLSCSGFWQPPDALALARWILDVFGEGEQA